MDMMLVLVGIAQLGFAIMVGAIGVTTAVRMVKRVGGFASMEDALQADNVAMSVAFSGAIVAMGILLQPAVYGTFSALELLLSAAEHWFQVVWVVAYALAYLGAGLLIGAMVISLGTQISIRLTPNIDEIAQIRDGNVSCALVLAVVLVILALLAQDGLKAVLDGFLPVPQLGRDMAIAPA